MKMGALFFEKNFFQKKGRKSQAETSLPKTQNICIAQRKHEEIGSRTLISERYIYVKNEKLASKHALDA